MGRTQLGELGSVCLGLGRDVRWLFHFFWAEKGDLS